MRHSPMLPRAAASLLLASLTVLVLATPVLAMPLLASPAGDWPAFGRDAGGSQHSPLKTINTKNVAKLKIAWVHRSGDFVDAALPKGTVFQATPLHVNGTLYFCTPLHRVFALDPAMGRERWVFDPFRINTATRVPGRCRGVAYWQDTAAPAARNGAPVAATACTKRIFKNGEGGRVYALDADTGALCRDFGAAKGHPGYVVHADYPGHGESIVGSASSPPAVLGDLVISGTSVNDGVANAKDGIVRAFDARSGEVRWEFNPIPADKRELSGAANVWSTISVDTARIWCSCRRRARRRTITAAVAASTSRSPMRSSRSTVRPEP